jgi:hypothetical protein
MNADKKKDKNCFWSYPRSSAFICGQSWFLHELLSMLLPSPTSHPDFHLPSRVAGPGPTDDKK